MTARLRLSAPHPRLAATFVLVLLMWEFPGVVLQLETAVFRWQGNATSPVIAAIWNALRVSYPALAFGGLLLIWSPTIRWTSSRARGITVLSLCYAVAVAGSTALMFDGLMSQDVVQSFIFLLTFIATVGASAICWEPPYIDSLTLGVHCPVCGYDLRGQRECRCPECGKTFLLGDLIPGHHEPTSP